MTGGVVVVAALAFVASFGAIHDFALRSGGIAREHAWMAPLFIDSFLFIGSCGDLWCALTRTDAEDGWRRMAAWSPKLLLVAAAAGSYGLNIAHAPATAPARVVAALPPTALVVTEVVLMFIVRRAARFRTARLAMDTEAPAPPPIAHRDLRAEARQLITARETHGSKVNGTELARQLGTAPATAAAYSLTTGPRSPLFRSTDATPTTLSRHEYHAHPWHRLAQARSPKLDEHLLIDHDVTHRSRDVTALLTGTAGRELDIAPLCASAPVKGLKKLARTRAMYSTTALLVASGADQRSGLRIRESTAFESDQLSELASNALLQPVSPHQLIDRPPPGRVQDLDPHKVPEPVEVYERPCVDLL
ncbi:MAG: DUF2637 domain-containing protein [Egibacteraceae bacterium]